MARKFLTAIDLGTNELQNAVIQNLAAASEPTGVKGRIYFDSTNNVLKFYDGTVWKAIASGGDLGSYQPLDGDLTAIAAITGTGLLKRTGVDTWTLDTNTYLTTETDPVFSASDAAGITATDITNWDTAYGWGNHASAGYLTTETDPIYTASSWYTTTNNSSNWDTAYGWGNHASAGYLVSGDLSGYVTLTGIETLSNKTISDSLYFNDGGTNQSIYANGNDFEIHANTQLILSTGNGDISLQPDSQAKVGSDIIATLTASQEFQNKELRGYTQLNPASGSQPNTGFGSLQYKDTGDGVTSDEVGLYIKSDRGWISPQSGGKMFITSYDDMVITSTVGNMQFFMDGGMYIGAVDSANQIIKRSDLSLFLTDAVTSIANTDGNITFSSSTGSVTANLANDIEIAGTLTVQGDLTVNGDVTTLNTTTVNVEDNIFVLNSNVTGTPAVNAGIEVERGDDTNSTLIWNETSNQWEAGLVGSTAEILLSGVATASDISDFNTAVDTEVDAYLTGSDSISVSSGAIDTTLATTSYLTKTGGLAVDKSTLETALATDGFTKKYAAQNSAITVSGGVATWTVTHNLGSRDVQVQVYEVSGYGAVEVDVVRTSTSVVTLSWNSASDVSADTYRVVVIG